MNRQREVIYEWRTGILLHGRAGELVERWTEEVVEMVVGDALGVGTGPGTWDPEELEREMSIVVPVENDLLAGAGSVGQVVDAALEEAKRIYEARREDLGAEIVAEVERRIVLSVIDNKWREHLAEMDYLRAGINLRAMGNRDPLVEYQNEAYTLFQELVETIKRDSVRYLFHVQVTERAPEPLEAPKVHLVTTGGGAAQAAKTPVRVGEKVGRNDLCPCGSGQKYKRCHGAA